MFTVLSAFAMALSVGQAEAGQWVPGGTFDPTRGIPVSFLRFLAQEGEGQMTIRCNAIDGLTIDIGVTGNATLPAGVTEGATIPATLAFVRADPATAEVEGNVLVRMDGAVLVTLSGAGAASLAPFLLAPAERIDVTIAGTTRPVPFADMTVVVENFAARCAGWPQ